MDTNKYILITPLFAPPHPKSINVRSKIDQLHLEKILQDIYKYGKEYSNQLPNLYLPDDFEEKYKAQRQEMTDTNAGSPKHTTPSEISDESSTKKKRLVENNECGKAPGEAIELYRNKPCTSTQNLSRKNVVLSKPSNISLKQACSIPKQNKILEYITPDTCGSLVYRQKMNPMFLSNEKSLVIPETMYTNQPMLVSNVNTLLDRSEFSLNIYNGVNHLDDQSIEKSSIALSTATDEINESVSCSLNVSSLNQTPDNDMQSQDIINATDCITNFSRFTNENILSDLNKISVTTPSFNIPKRKRKL